MEHDSKFDSLVPFQLFDRRSFTVTSLGTGFALAVRPVMPQTAIKTDDTDLLTREVKVPDETGQRRRQGFKNSRIRQRAACWPGSGGAVCNANLEAAGCAFVLRFAPRKDTTV
jgi:hypothetical protein